jgi:dihydrofolate synthase/folylpolyglutamate synthase
VIEEIARERAAPIVTAWSDTTADRVEPTPGQPTRIRLRTPVRDYGEVMLSLRGRHQIGNAVVAVRILEQLAGIGIDVPPSAIVAGLAQVSWPGRLEHRRLPDGREMILDAAHNPAGAATLAAYLAETFAEKPPLVFAAMGDKDVRGMFEALLPAVSTLVVTRASTARSADPETLAREAAAVAPDLPVRVEPNRADALAAAWADSPRIVVAGSIFLLGDVISEAGLS